MRRMRHLTAPVSKLPFTLLCMLWLPWSTAMAAQQSSSAPASRSAPAAVEPAAAKPTPTTDVVNPTVDAASSGAAPPAEAAVESSVPASAPPPVTAPVATPSVAKPNVASAPPAPLPPAVPLAAYFEVGFVIQTNWNTAPAFDFFSDDDVLPKGGLVVGADIVQLSAMVLALDLNVLFTQTDTTGPLQTYIREGAIDETDLGVGLTLRYELLSWLAPQVRIGGGVALQEAVLSGTDFDDSRQEFTTGYATLGGGFSFTSPAHRLSRTRSVFNSLALRVIVEGGYQLGQELEFVVKGRRANDSGTPNAVADTPLGVLPQSGAYVRFSVLARF